MSDCEVFLDGGKGTLWTMGGGQEKEIEREIQGERLA